MPGDFGDVFNDPDIQAVLGDPEIIMKIQAASGGRTFSFLFFSKLIYCFRSRQVGCINERSSFS
jgi:hypothetical protein